MVRQESRTQIASSFLEPMAVLLSDNQILIKELPTEPFAERDSGILESYPAKIRRDGFAKHAGVAGSVEQRDGVIHGGRQLRRIRRAIPGRFRTGCATRDHCCSMKRV